MTLIKTKISHINLKTSELPQTQDRNKDFQATLSKLKNSQILREMNANLKWTGLKKSTI